MSMFFTSDDKTYQVELNNMIMSYKGNAVLTGFVTTPQSTMFLNVSPGQFHLDNEVYEISSISTVTIPNSHQIYHRIDIIVLDVSAGNVKVVFGDAGIIALPPDIPLNDILLALVHIPPGSNVIGTDQIVDERIVVKPVGLVYEISDDLLSSNDSEVQREFGVWDTVKTSGPLPLDLFSNLSDLKIKYEMKSHDGRTVKGKIYRNDEHVGLGVEHTTSSTVYVTYSQDLDGWSAGDIIKLKCWVQHDGNFAYVRNFRAYGGLKIKSILNW